MAKKSYNYAQLEAVALEMRASPDMVFYYEYQKPVTTSPSGDVLDLVKEFGDAIAIPPGAVQPAWPRRHTCRS